MPVQPISWTLMGLIEGHTAHIGLGLAGYSPSIRCRRCQRHCQRGFGVDDVAVKVNVGSASGWDDYGMICNEDGGWNRHSVWVTMELTHRHFFLFLRHLSDCCSSGLR